MPQFSDRDLDRPMLLRDAVDRDLEMPGSEFEHLENGRPEVGDEPEAALVSSRRAAGDRGADADPGHEHVHARADPHRVDPSRVRRSRDELDRLARDEGDIELARDQVRRSRRDDAERDRAPREAVDDGGNRAVPPRGDDQVEALAQARADDLSERIPLAGLMNGVVDTGRRKMPLERLEHGLADRREPRTDSV